MSSDSFNVPSSPSRMFWISFWKISDAHEMSKFSLLYLLSPTCVENGVMYLESGCRRSWWYPWLRSSLKNLVAPLRSERTSSIVGMMCLDLWTALFGALISTQTDFIRVLWFRSYYGGDHRAVTTLMFNDICFLELSQFFIHFAAQMEGHSLMWWATGLTDGYRWSLISWPLTRPTPVNRSG